MERGKRDEVSILMDRLSVTADVDVGFGLVINTLQTANIFIAIKMDTQRKK